MKIHPITIISCPTYITHQIVKQMWLIITSLILLEFLSACAPLISTTGIPSEILIHPTKQIQTTSQLSISTLKPTSITEQSQLQSTLDIYGYTHQRADGNRLVAGSGQLPEVLPIEIQLPGVPS